MQPFFINVIVPLALRSAFTYRVPDELIEEMIPGKRVVVPFGPKRLYTALIIELDVLPTKGHLPKVIDHVLDSEPVVTSKQLEFWRWISEYYMCGLGMVMSSAFPSAMRLSSETNLILLDEQVEIDQLDNTDQMVLANLSDDRLIAVKNIEQLGSKSKIQRSIDKLIKLGLVAVDESIKDNGKPLVKSMVSISAEFLDENRMREALEKLGRAPKQLQMLMKLLELTNYFNGSPQLVTKNRLINASGGSSNILKGLINKGFIQVEDVAADMNIHSISTNTLELSLEQKTAFKEIQAAWQKKEVVLLHGVTGSGKTLLYANAINRALEHGGQVLMLVPEIALTTQLVSRLKTMINAELMVYHSRFSNKERISMWTQTLGDDAPQVIIGARSAVFLPFKDLRLVVVDEEHEASYKQSEGLPHYNGKDAAIWLALNHNAKVLLGSATPTINSTFLAQNGKYGLVKLDERFGGVSLPETQIVDLRVALKERKMKADFTQQSVEQIEDSLKNGKQVIIFQNRRGYAPYQMCESCGWSAECNNCDVNLTYHRYFEKLLCHYCGFSIKQPTHCPRCASPRLIVKGLGTEKIEDDLDILFPAAKIARMDADTTRSKSALQNMITAFEEGAYDVLVGTQMVTKGLDFENVGLVVVMNADSLWNRPDYQAFERAFQLLTQVSGRAGRKHAKGKVIIQTFNPEHPVLMSVKESSYDAMYQLQVNEREQYLYPPFSKLIKLQISHKDAKFNKQAADFFASNLRNVFGKRVLGPEEPPIARIRNRYIRHVYLKLEKSISLSKAKNLLWKEIDVMEGHQDYKKVRIQIDVDP